MGSFCGSLSKGGEREANTQSSVCRRLMTLTYVRLVGNQFYKAIPIFLENVMCVA